MDKSIVSRFFLTHGVEVEQIKEDNKQLTNEQIEQIFEQAYPEG